MFNFLLRCLDTENQHKRYLRTFYHALEMYPLSKVEFLTAIRMKKALGDNRGAEHIQRYLSSCDRKYHVELLPGNHVGYGPWDGFSLASPTPEPTRPVPPSEPMQTLTMDEVYSQAAELDWSGEKRRIGLKFTGVEPAGSPSPPETPVVTASSSKMSQLSKQPSEEKESSDTNSDSGSDTDFLGLAATPPPSVAVGDVDTVAESLRRPRTNIFKVLASFLDAGSGASQLKEVLRRVKGTGFGQVAFRALKVIREQNRELLDGEVYNLVLYFLGKNGRSSDGLSVIEWMTEDGFKPSLISCSLLINSTSHTGDWETAARVLSAMRKAQTPPNPQVLHCLINAYKSGGQWDKALAVFFKMRMLRMEVSETLGTELRAGKTAAENAMHVDPES
uniref:Pentacotripeptide-repeat region of PRORP domain-containing protein n=2 Tax=Amorphochlora amoebiformis TaxID=1561963 RepID=A0A7S0DW22_9EUKA|mmetsp:Transcript_9115/g.14424  ORF Transcript_9115/g.14424 Transcript_9115/m.14424 type:complete len:390 (+) Transcript_9115:192-1361(+)